MCKELLQDNIQPKPFSREEAGAADEQHSGKVLSVTSHQGSADGSHSEIPSTLLGWLFRTTEQDSSAGEDVEKQEASCVASGSMKGLGCCGYRHGSAPQTEHELPPCTI